MIEIVLIGLNHKTASVDLRECIAFNAEETRAALRTLGQETGIKEVVIFSTCNRVEILLTCEDSRRAIETATVFLTLNKNVQRADVEKVLYVHQGEDAIRHMFRVAASLDSMVVGEPQILGQIKQAYHTATQTKTSGVILNRLMHRTFFVAKRVRSETGIGDNAVSISYAAVQLSRKIFGDLDGKQVLMLGAGEMAELAVEHLIRHKVGDIRVANRTFERGLQLAKRFNGRAIKFEEIVNALEVVDIIISSTGATQHVIRAKDVKSVMRKRRNRPLFFIDIAVPRDIDPKIHRLDNAYVYDIDDLKGVIEENIQDRKREAIKGERIIDEAVIGFRQWYANLDVVPTIKALRQKISTIAQTEIEKTLQSLPHLSDKDRQAVGRMKDALINKMLHDPTLFLKGDGCHGDKANYLDITRKLFKLDE